ncbi:MAG TPA: hypothetical protein VG961_03515 [Ignavibacteria bacterium]|nr:hypothetical protein [Ignavibacteria bacterium]
MRKLIFISSGILFLLTASGLVFIGAGEKDSMFITLSAAAVPFLFTAYWSFFSVYFEKHFSPSAEYFTYSAAGSAGIGAFYHKVIALPLFLVLFGSAALCIACAFLAFDRSSEDFSIIMLAISVLYSLSITLYYSAKIVKNFRKEEYTVTVNSKDGQGIKIAFFFASVATLGLFPLIYFLYKTIKKQK